MQLECPNCNTIIEINPDTFLNQKHILCYKCMFAIELRNPDGSLKHLKFRFEDKEREGNEQTQDEA